MERFKLIVAESLRSLGANLSTTLAATVTVLIGMFLLGLFIAFGSWVVSWSNHVKRELVVKVDFKTSGEKGGPATREQENAVARMLSSNPKIKYAHFISKAAAFKQMQKLHPELTRDLPGEPWRRVVARFVQLCREPLHVALGGGECLRCCDRGIEALVERVQLGLRCRRAREQVVVGLSAEATLGLRDLVEL